MENSDRRSAEGALVYAGARDALTEAVFGRLRAMADQGGTWVLIDAPDADLAETLSGARALVYAAASRAGDPRGVTDEEDARSVLEAAVEAGVPRTVLLSSIEVCPPSHQHLGLLSEDRFKPRPSDNRVSESWRALEELAREAVAGSDSCLTVLRAAPTPVPGGRDFFSRLLGRPVAFTVPGFDPSIQLLAPEDLARAVALAVDAPAPAEGSEPRVYHVVPRGTAPVHRAVRLAGGHRLALPLWLQRGVRRAAGGLLPVHPPDRVDFLRYPWSAAGERTAAELGFRAERSTAEAAAALAPRPGHRAAEEADPPDPAWEWGSEGIDPFGMDREYVARYGRTLFRFLHDAYWRIEHRGVEHVPRSGPGVLTGVHRGFMPYDGVMALQLLVRERGRYPRFLLHPTLTKFPFLANFMTKLGGIMACQENADWVLERGGLVGIFPEGIRGAFTPYRRAYRLGKFGRDEYVRMALRNRAPIIPFVTVGSAEIFPILGRIDWGWWKRYSEWPYLPITPTFPLLPVPLPSKWHTRVLPPLHVEEEHGPEAADDPEVVRSISAEVRRRMAAAIADMLERRRSIFFGSVFDQPTAQGGGRGEER